MPSTKRARLSSIAKRHYVHDNYTYKEIAALLGTTEKTIGTWAREDNWEEEKAEKLATVCALNESMYDYTLSLINSLQQTEKDGKEPSQKRLRGIEIMVNGLKNAANYEAARAARLKPVAPAKAKLTQDEIDTVIEECLGVPRPKQNVG